MSILHVGPDPVGLFPTKQLWFWRWAIIRLGIFLILGHWYDMFVFQDVSKQLTSGHGVYAISSLWLAENGDGYYAYPPVFAYFLGVAGLVASLLGDHWYIHHIAIKLPLLAGDLATFFILRRINERAAKAYWTLWFVPLLAIAQIQPDIWAGLLLLVAYLASKQERWNVAGGLIGLAAAIKFIPAVVIPFILVYLWRRGALWRVAQFAVYALGAFIAAWLPYILIYHDAWQFQQVLEFHMSRTGGGLNLITPITSVFHLNHLWDGALGDAQLILAVLHFVSGNYIFLTGSVMLLLFISAMVRSWTLERSFLIPMVGMLISNRLVHEQYFMQVLPLMLIAAPEMVSAVFWPFSIFVLAAGTPLRFIPREINPVDLATIGTNMITGPVLTFAVGLTAVMFVIRLTRGCVRMLSLPLNPLLHIARKALVPIAAVLVLLIVIIQRPISTGVHLEPHPGLDVLGNGRITLLPVYAQNTTAHQHALRFVIGHSALQTVWIPVGGSDTVIVPPNSGRMVHLYPKQFDRGIPTNAAFQLTAIAIEEDLAARVSIKAPHSVSSASIWTIPGLPSPVRLRGNASTSKGVGELASISIHCVEQQMAVRMTVKRSPKISSEWTAAEIKFELDPLFVRRMIERGFAVWLYNPIAYEHDLTGWPTALQSVEIRDDELESTLTIAFSRGAGKSFDLTSSRRVVVLQVPHGGWERVDFEPAQHAADLGWTKHSRLTLSFITAAHYRAPGLYEANFGVVDSSGGLRTCVTLEASRERTSEK